MKEEDECKSEFLSAFWQWIQKYEAEKEVMIELEITITHITDSPK